MAYHGRISPHTAHASIIFDASILEDKFVCSNYVEKYRDEVRSRVLKLLHTSASQGKKAGEAHRFEHHWRESIRMATATVTKI